MRYMISGMLPWAMLCASFTPEPNLEQLELRVNVSAGTGSDAGVGVGLRGAQLRVGIPEEFAEAAFIGARRGVRRVEIPSGRLTVCGGGFDAVDSNYMAFWHCARVLVAVLIDPKFRSKLASEAFAEMDFLKGDPVQNIRLDRA